MQPIRRLFERLNASLVMLLFCSQAMSAPLPVVVYYIPFSVDTYEPVSRSTISCAAWEKWVISDEGQTKTLLDLLKPGIKAPFSERLVRMLVSAGRVNYYIDQTGIVSLDQKTYKTDKGKIEEFRKSLMPEQIQNLRGSKGCR